MKKKNLKEGEIKEKKIGFFFSLWRMRRKEGKK